MSKVRLKVEASFKIDVLHVWCWIDLFLQFSFLYIESHLIISLRMHIFKNVRKSVSLPLTLFLTDSCAWCSS